MKKHAKIAAAIAAVVVCMGFGATPATAADWTPPAPPAVLVDGYENNTGDLYLQSPATDRSAAAVNVHCTIKVNDPHYSVGGGGTIFKTDITCTGTGIAVVQVRVRGLLQFDAAESPTQNAHQIWEDRAESDQTQNVVVNGTYKRYYTPVEGTTGGTGSGFWMGTATSQIVGPGGVSNVESDQKLVFGRFF